MGDYKGGSIWPGIAFIIVVLIGIYVLSESRDPIPDDLIPVPPSMSEVR